MLDSQVYEVICELNGYVDSDISLKIKERRKLGTKLCVKSHGTVLVGTRWSFSDKALWISDVPLTLARGYHYGNGWLD